MSAPTLLGHIAVLWLQIGLVLMVCLGLAHGLRRAAPQRRLRFYQLTLGLAVALPLLQLGLGPDPFSRLWPTLSSSPEGIEALQISAFIDVVANEEAREVASAAPIDWPLSALGLFAAGALFGLVRLGLGFVHLRGLVARAHLYDGPDLRAGAGEEHLGHWADVPCLESDEVSSPVTFGWLRPVVIVPPTLRELDAEARHAVWVHETLHIARSDWPMLLLEESLRAVAWFQPAVGRLLDRLSLAREQVIDARVVELGCRRKPYLEALMSFAIPTGESHSRIRTAPALAQQRSHLLQRVRKLTQPLSQDKAMTRFLSLRSSLLGFVALLVAAFTIAFLPLQSSVAIAESTLPTPAPLADVAASTPEAPIAPQPIDPVPAIGSPAPAPVAEAPEAPIDDDEDGNVAAAPIYVDGNVKAPKKVHAPAPRYTQDARESRVQGVVIVQAIIDREGLVEDVKVLKGLPLGLDKAAVDAIRQWQFEPATLDGNPVAVYYNLTVNFRLASDQDDEGEG